MVALLALIAQSEKLTPVDDDFDQEANDFPFVGEWYCANNGYCRDGISWVLGNFPTITELNTVWNDTHRLFAGALVRNVNVQMTSMDYIASSWKNQFVN